MSKTRPFFKPATTYAEQVTQLWRRGLIISDSDRAQFYLQHLNYYRLAAYWLPYEADHATHTFRPGTTFEDVLNRYTFDRELRLLVLDAISPAHDWRHRLRNLLGRPSIALDAMGFPPNW